MDYKIIVFAVVLTIVLVVATQVWKQRILKKLMEALQKQDFDAFFKRLDTLSCKYFYPPFNREYMRLNGYVLKGDKKKVEECFELLLQMRKSKKQELDVVIKAFYYYIDENNKRKCKALLERMKTIADESITQECQVLYDILLEEETKYIEDMEEQLKDEALQDAQKGMFHYMLALQYNYKHDEQKKKEHLDAAAKSLKGTPYELKIRELKKQK